MTWKFRNLAIGLAVSSLALSPAANARKADRFTDLNGMDAASAETQLRTRGLTYTDGRKGAYGESYSYWWDNDGKDCLVVEVSDGRVMTVNDAQKSDCHHSDDGAAAAVAVVAGAALIGALIAHKSDDHDDKQHFDNAQHEREYDRGYQDGLYHRTYHNYDSSTYYSRGYSKGVQQRSNVSQDHHSYGGYGDSQARYKDLSGDRASTADSEMRKRGFHNVDGFKSGSTAYTIWNRPSSSQCLQMAVANGRVVSIVDIHRHAKCR